ncbi:DUF3592 domain-containing protein [Thalassotalea algicola]
MLAFGFFWAVHSIYVIYSYLNSYDWVETPSQVVSVNFVRHDDSQGRQDTYERKVSYKYSYFGQEFLSDRESFGFVRFFSDPNEKYVSKQTINVYVNPNSPSQSVIYRFNGATFLMQLLIMLISFGGVYLFRPKWLKNITRRSSKEF